MLFREQKLLRNTPRKLQVLWAGTELTLPWMCGSATGPWEAPVHPAEVTDWSD